MEDPNKNTNTNDGYSFYNTENDHGFNDDTPAAKTSKVLKIVVLIGVGMITSVVVILMFSGMLTKVKEKTNTVNNTTNTTTNAIQSIVDSQNRIFNQIDSMFEDVTKRIENKKEQ